MKMKEMTRNMLIKEIKKIMPINNNKITWTDLCANTKFDSWVTALAYGLHWNDDLLTCKLTQLKMALYNLQNYPKIKGEK